MDGFQIIFDNKQKLIEKLCEYSCIHIFFDSAVNIDYINEIINELPKKCRLIKSAFATGLATEKFIDSLVYRGEDFVLSFGGLHLQSLTKYYAYQNNISYALVPFHEVTEYSFSKFAYIKDKYFCFYECEKPQFVYIAGVFFNQKDLNKFGKILSYKNIVEFEFEFCKDVLETERDQIKNVVNCINLRDNSLKSLIKIFAICAISLDRSKTYNFLGTEYLLLSMLLNYSDNIIDNLIVANNVLYKFYDCIFKFELISVEPNINYHLYKLKKEYNIDLSDVIDNVQVINQEKKHRQKYRYNAYMPYLKKLFLERSVNFVPSYVDYSGKQLESSLALCSFLSSGENIIKFARDFGYFENLIKDI